VNEAVPSGTDPDDDLRAFEPIDAWVFDLDDTLYSIGPELAALYDGRMRGFIEREIGLGPEEASRMQHDLFERHGATARGLFVEHGIQPDEFLEYVHDIDHALIEPDPALSKLIGELPGRRYVLTNSPISHATRAIEQIGMAAHLTDVFDFASFGGYTKPDRRVYDAFIAATGALPKCTAMFEDVARNLVEPQRLGMISVLVAPPRTRELFRADWDLEAGSHPAVDFVTDDLRGFLTSVLAEIRSPD
jgi:putative hydrolase of the HAD superfamily